MNFPCRYASKVYCGKQVKIQAWAGFKTCGDGFLRCSKSTGEP